eukprot:jgi/Botrbrau1/2299/Bobra.101_2s0120.1
MQLYTYKCTHVPMRCISKGVSNTQILGTTCRHYPQLFNRAVSSQNCWLFTLPCEGTRDPRRCQYTCLQLRHAISTLLNRSTFTVLACPVSGEHNRARTRGHGMLLEES